MTKNKIRTLAASAVVVCGLALTPAIGRPDSQPAPAPQRVVPTAERDAVEAAALAAFARANHLSGLSPASLAPVPLGCRGLSPASAQDCPAAVFVTATRDDVDQRP
ncbi:MAG: hypothetical protein ABJD24_07405 [Acidimicrobiales bacterium]